MLNLRVRSGISHTKDSLALMRQAEVLVLELFSINTLSSSSIVVGEISSLAHELLIGCGIDSRF